MGLLHRHKGLSKVELRSEKVPLKIEALSNPKYAVALC